MSTQSFGMLKMRCDVLTFCCWLLCLFVRSLFLLSSVFLWWSFNVVFSIFFLRCSWHIITRISVQANLTYVSNNRKKCSLSLSSAHWVNKQNDNTKCTLHKLSYWMRRQCVLHIILFLVFVIFLHVFQTFHHFELEQLSRKLEI